MSVADDRFFDRLILRLPFETSRGEMTLEQYRQRQPTRPGEPTPIYYFQDDADAARFYEICRMRGTLALNAGKCFEESLLKKLVDRQPGVWTLRRLDHANGEELYQRLCAEEAAAFQPLLSAVDKVVKEKHKPDIQIGIRRFEPANISAVLLEVPRLGGIDQLRGMLNHPFRVRGLADLSGEITDALAKHPQELLLNSANPLVQRLAQLVKWDDQPSQLALSGLYLAALLQSKGRLSTENSTAIYVHLLAALETVLSLRSVLELKPLPS
jgi:HSP90 family molecular chaperone